MARILMLLYRMLTAVLMWPAGLVLSRHPNFSGTIPQRLGLELPDPKSAGPAVWVHAASLGEVKAAAGLIRAMKKAYPGTAILLSSMTATGRQAAHSIPELDLVFPLPFDAAHVMRRYLRHLRPKALLIMETELWPCMISEARALGIPVAIVNGRMTDRSERRYARVPALSRSVLSGVQVFAMAEEDAARFSRLGAGRVKTLGNLKLDSVSEVDLSKRDEMREFLRIKDRPVFIAGSIREGEEEAVFEAVRTAHEKVPGLVSILAPRHPGQMGTLAELARQSGIEWCLKSRMEYGTPLLLVDTMGELFSLYGASDAAFVGGSLVDTGRQNILEPIAWGVPTLHGPHMDNFTWALEVVKGFTIQVDSPSALAEAVVDIVTGPGKYLDLAQGARSRLEGQKGVTIRYLESLKEYLD